MLDEASASLSQVSRLIDQAGVPASPDPRRQGHQVARRWYGAVHLAAFRAADPRLRDTLADAPGCVGRPTPFSGFASFVSRAGVRSGQPGPVNDPQVSRTTPVGSGADTIGTPRRAACPRDEGASRLHDRPRPPPCMTEFLPPPLVGRRPTSRYADPGHVLQDRAERPEPGARRS